MAVSGSFPIFLRRPSVTLRPDKGVALVARSPYRAGIVQIALRQLGKAAVVSAKTDYF